VRWEQKQKKSLYFSLTDSTEGLYQVYSRAHKRGSLQQDAHHKRYHSAIAPLLERAESARLSSAVQGNCVNGKSEPGRACVRPYIRDTILSQSHHSQSLRITNSPVQQQIRRQPADEHRDTEWHLHGMSHYWSVIIYRTVDVGWGSLGGGGWTHLDQDDVSLAPMLNG